MKIHQLKIDFNVTEQISRFVYIYILEADSLYLIDSGVSGCEKDITGYLAGIQRDPSEIRGIFLTHAHVDHAELALALNKEFGTKIYIGEADGERLKGFDKDTKQPWNGAEDTMRAMGFSHEQIDYVRELMKTRALFGSKECKFTYVHDGDKLCYGGYELICIDAAGHSPGQTCLYLPKKKLMFFGDHLLYSITPNVTTWSVDENPLLNYINNIRKFKDYEIDIPLPAHRDATCSAHERIDQILRHHEIRLGEALDALREYGELTAYEIASHLHWNVHDDNWDEFPINQKISAVGEVISHLSYLLHEGKITKKTEDSVDKYAII